GLIRGIAVAAKHVNKNTRIIGVQTERFAAMHKRFHQIEPIRSLPTETNGERIPAKEPSKQTLPLINQYVDDIVTVTEEEVASAILYMLERNKTLMEGAGAAALAALFAHNDFIKSRHCGVIVSGGNFDIDNIPLIQQLANKCPA